MSAVRKYFHNEKKGYYSLGSNVVCYTSISSLCISLYLSLSLSFSLPRPLSQQGGVELSGQQRLERLWQCLHMSTEDRVDMAVKYSSPQYALHMRQVSREGWGVFAIY